MSDDQSLDAMKRRLEELSTQIQRLEGRPAAPAPAVPPPFNPETFHRRSQSSAAPAAVVAKPTSPASPGDSGVSRFLGIASAFCFLLASVYLIRLTIQSGWLTPPRQVGLSALVGACLVAAGLLRGREGGRYWGILPATGVAVLDLSVYGAYFYYHLLTAGVTIAFCVLVAALCLYLYRHYRYGYYAFIAMAGVYGSSFLLPGQAGADPVTLFLFYAVWDSAFSALSVGMKDRLFSIVGAYFAFASAAWLMDQILPAGPGSQWTRVSLQSLQFAIYAGGTALYSVRHRSGLTKVESLYFLPLLLFFYFLQYDALRKIQPSYALCGGLSFAGGLVLIHEVVRRNLKRDRLDSSGALLCCVGIVLVHLTAAHFTETWASWVGIALMLAVPPLDKRLGDLSAKWALRGFFALVAIGTSLLVLTDSSVPLIHRCLQGLLCAGIGLGGYFVRGSAESSDQAIDREGEKILFLGMAAIHLAFALHRAVALWNVGGQSRGFVESLLWGLAAFGGILLGRARRDRLFAKSSVWVLTAALAKVLLVDIHTLPPLPRVIGLFALGAILFGSGLAVRYLDQIPEKTS
jgi:uncharacterized membrane protein